MKKVITVTNGVARNPVYRLKSPINLCIEAGEHVAIVGPNGAGKSLLVNAIVGRYPLLRNEVEYNFEDKSSLASEQIKYITFRDSYGESDNSYYYQQRWNSQDLESTPLVRECLPQPENKILEEKLFQIFKMERLLDKHLVLLSSGELRKFQLIKVLLCNPKVLIMDNPFIGLDAPTRNQLENLLCLLAKNTDLQIILVLSKDNEIPSFITHVIPVDSLICGPKILRETYAMHRISEMTHVLSEEKKQRILNLPEKEQQYFSEHVIDLNNVSIRYGSHTILNGLTWNVKTGEYWALHGENGAGKSTLLSLVCADNPQSYACDIALFGKKRGSGESIWEIKKHIGYVSPEMHRAYFKNLPAVVIVASGLHDSIGLYKQINPQDLKLCVWWMDIFGIANLKDRSFLQLSSGEQRLVLLARAFVKDPELLILDEPLHGLDLRNCQMVKDIIEAFCQRKNKALVMVSHYEEDFPSVINHRIILHKN